MTPATATTLLAPLALIFAGAIVAPWLIRSLPRSGAFVLSAAPGFGFCVFLAALIRRDEPAVALPWVPMLDVELAFRLHGLALLFALLITGIGCLVLAYAGSYMRGY